MNFLPTSIDGLFVVEADRHIDQRGSFSRIYSQADFKKMMLDPVEIQWSISTNICAFTLRGLHFQKCPHQEAKLVRCIAGHVFDVAVDIRRDSKTFGRSFAMELRAESNTALFIPRGFAHGFLTLTDNAALLYAISTEYVADAARGIRWNDPSLNIDWPCNPKVISPRDRTLPTLSDVPISELQLDY